MHAMHPVIVPALADGIGRDDVGAGIGSQQEAFVKIARAVVLIAPAMTVVVGGTGELRVVLVGTMIAPDDAGNLGVDACLAVGVPPSRHGVGAVPMPIPASIYRVRARSH